MRQRAWAVGVLLSGLAFAACGSGASTSGDDDGRCTGNPDCPGGVCIDGVCRYFDGGDGVDIPGGDADAPLPDGPEGGDGPGADADDGVAEWTPGDERCGDGLDNDGDTIADEGCSCAVGETQPCYTGPEASAGIGICARGVQTCEPLGEFGEWGECTGSVLPGAEECGDATDNDCDGSADEGCVCTSGDRRPCYTGPAGTDGVGECRAGSQYCLDTGDGGTGWSDCGGQTLPTADLCDGLDNDCDGTADQGCDCPPGTTRGCYDGPASSRGRGICADGNQDCVLDPGGALASWSLCGGWIGPAVELCGNGLDDDCDDLIDEGCTCYLGENRACYTGPAGTEGIGICEAGRQSCIPTATGLDWGPCAGDITPGTDVCDGLDNDCDGTADNLCECPPLTEEPCYGGPAGTRGIGNCLDGRRECLWDTGGEVAVWSACSGWVGPGTETCNLEDDDCDGLIDEICTCSRGATRSCYSGPAGTSGVGVCRSGTQTCIDIGSGLTGWGTCTGEVTPSFDVCGDGLDNDCDGTRDEGCACTPGATRSCYSGPAGTAGVGICRAGSQSCIALPAGGSEWTPCSGEILPSIELCADATDNDCDGTRDEGCLCTPGTTQPCYSGPVATRGVGECRDGSQACIETPGSGSSWGTCTGERLPATEVCGNSRDDDCDGSIDEGCSHAPWTTCPASPVTMIARATITLTASDGDAGGDIVSRRWEVVSGPPGMIYTFGCSTCASTTFRADIAGVYQLRYTVTDSHGDSSSCTVQVNVTGLGLRVEVTWTSTTADLDTHLLNGSGSVWATAASDGNDCHFRNCRPSLAWPPAGTDGDSRLDIDDVNGLGPENINVDVINVGEAYRIGVHWWSGWGSTSSDCTVRIFCGDISATPVRVFTRTLHGGASSCCGAAGDDLWKVADVVFSDADNCTVSDINVIVPSGPSNPSR